MNILPKKKWHVRTKDNIARVRRDEQQAADEEKEKQRKTSLAEQEARTDVLRKQARARQGSSLGADDLAGLFGGFQEGEAPVEVVAEHVNIFKDAEEGRSTALINVEHEEEKKAETEKYEKSIGYLTYLGQSASEAQHVKPWYTLSHEKRTEVPTSSGLILQQGSKNSDSKIKDFHDPLNSIKSYLTKTDSLAQRLAITAGGEFVSSTPEKRAAGDRYGDGDGSYLQKKYKKAEEEVRRPKEISGISKSIEELRAERLRREKGEHQRTKQLLVERSGGVITKPPTRVEQGGARQQKYNSQFNPQLAKQNQNFERNNYY